MGNGNIGSDARTRSIHRLVRHIYTIERAEHEQTICELILMLTFTLTRERNGNGIFAHINGIERIKKVETSARLGLGRTLNRSCPHIWYLGMGDYSRGRTLTSRIGLLWSMGKVYAATHSTDYAVFENMGTKNVNLNVCMSTAYMNVMVDFYSFIQIKLVQLNLRSYIVCVRNIYI